MTIPNILIGGNAYPENGWAIIFAGGSASGKSTLIKNGRLKFKGEALSTDTLGEEMIEVHNNAAKYATEDPQRLKEAEKLVAAGLVSRYPETNILNKVQNLVLDFDAKTVSTGKVSTILSNGAHAQKESFFKHRIDANAANGLANVLLDMTGKEREVNLYTEYLKEKGYKIALVWVITNRSVALLWNHLRPRSMKVGAVHTGHDEPNKYLLQALMDGRLKDMDDAWLVFNSTESIGREMTDEEKSCSAVRLTKNIDGKFLVDEILAKNVKAVLGPNRPSAEGENAETPQWQKDETGKSDLIIDDAFFEKYTREVTLENGSKARALLQLRSAYDKKKGGLVVFDDGPNGTNEPKLQKCNSEDTPTYPYVIYTEADKGKKVQRRHGNGSKYKLKYEKSVNEDNKKYASDDWMDKFFTRISLLKKVAEQNGINVPCIKEFIVSFLDSDKKECENRIKAFYKEHHLKEPALPAKPKECYNVNPPVREQFRSDASYNTAVELYPQQKADYEKAVREWNKYYDNF